MTVPEQDIHSSANHLRPRFRGRVALVAGVLALVLISLGVWSGLFRRSEPEFLWLSPVDFSRATGTGPVMALCYKVMNLMPPLGRAYMSRRQHLNISARLYSLTEEGERITGIGAAASTNPAGGRAWLLPAANMKNLRDAIRTNPEAILINQAAISTVDGIRCAVVVGSGTTAQDGLMVDIMPKVKGGWVRLSINATSTRMVGLATLGRANLRTNLVATCAAHIPSEGGVVLAGTCADLAGRSNYWLLISAAVVDSKGIPIKPPHYAKGR